jgi:aminoglycoside 2''-phosphotransferase
MNKQELYLARISDVAPELEIHTAHLHTRDGQFNDILIVNEELIFRFPRTIHEAKVLMHEVTFLSKIQNVKTLPVPNPLYVSVGKEVVNENFMGYRMIPGEPLLRTIMHTIQDDAALDNMAAQIAMFMQELHSTPPEKIGLALPLSDTRDEWQNMYQQFRDKLFPFMRVDARKEVAHNFETFLNNPQHFRYTPVLRHGDLGGSNILYDPQKLSVTGVIDFSFAGIGDPALDVAAISTCGDDFFQRIRKVYPDIESMLERATFYKSTYALQEALYGLRDDDKELFESGIAEYV